MSLLKMLPDCFPGIFEIELEPNTTKYTYIYFFVPFHLFQICPEMLFSLSVLSGDSQEAIIRIELRQQKNTRVDPLIVGFFHRKFHCHNWKRFIWFHVHSIGTTYLLAEKTNHQDTGHIKVFMWKPRHFSLIARSSEKGILGNAGCLSVCRQ